MAADPKITLYHFPSSYYSQIARLAFAEKSVPYVEQIVDILSGENYDPHYLELNPACEVPAITVDGRPVFGVQGSQKIMDYLDSIADSKDSSTDHSNMETFRRRCMGLPITELNVGIVKYPHLVNGRKLSQDVIDRFTRGRVNKREVLEAKMKQYPHLAATYQEKLDRVKRSDDQKDENSMKVYLEDLDAFLDETERQLETQAGDQGMDYHEWLFGQSFTNADIVLAVLLARLEMLACAELYWGSTSRRPLLGSYYRRLKERPSFRKECVTQYP